MLETLTLPTPEDTMSTDQSPDATDDSAVGEDPVEQLADEGLDPRTDEPGRTEPEAEQAGSDASTF